MTIRGKHAHFLFLFALVLSLAHLAGQAQPTKAVLDAPAPASSTVKLTLGPAAHLIGSGELTWFGFRVYQAQLWGAENLAANFANQNFALELRYLRPLAGEAIAERSLKEIQKLGLGNAEQHHAWLKQLKAVLPSVSKGDRITGVHIAGVGAAFYLNDHALGRIDDASFAQAFFAIWLDPKTSAPALRSALLNAKPL